MRLLPPRSLGIRLAWAVAVPLLLFALLDAAFPFRYRIAYAQLLLDRAGAPFHAYLAPDGRWRFHTPLSDIAPHLQEAVVYKEDRWFYWHLGVNPLAVLRAAAGNWQAGHTASGASTITMQVVRLLEPRPRTLGSKLAEAFRALQLEWRCSKAEILELYLNLAPYGGNIEGVGAASYFFFGTEPRSLSPAQAAVLAIVPNRPTSWALGKRNPLLLEARNRWIQRFGEAGIWGEEEVRLALGEPMADQRRPAPRGAPQFAHWMRRQFPHADSLRTSLDPQAQRLAEQLLARQVRSLMPYGVHNGAVLVLDRAARRIAAYVGSPQFDDAAHGGQVDAVQAVRSPGSTLKPLLYAWAFDAGRLTPQGVVYDVPQEFDGYAPQNFDLQFRGPVPAADALAASLNVPAVKLLETMGVPGFVEKLQASGLRQLSARPEGLGLSLALGGCGASLFELAGLYGMLASQGRYAKPTGLLAASDTATVRVLDEGAAYMALDAISELQRPNFPHYHQYVRGMPQTAWKTGTSYGRHDAWCVGVTAQYVVAVWLGNVDGRPSQALVGGEVAAPLLLDLCRALEPNGGTWLQAPERVAMRAVCRETGLPPSPQCTVLTEDAFIPLVSPMAACGCRAAAWVSADSAWTYCTACLPDSGFSRAWFPQYPPEVGAYFHAIGRRYAQPPPHALSCPDWAIHGAPRIVSPRAGRRYRGLEGPVKLVLEAQAAPGVQRLFWYLNRRFCQSGGPHERLLAELPKGPVEVSCTDDRGRTATVQVWVE